ncbi:MAG: hypothetical protein A3A73_02600 [Omnitrophica bacterium RIFCSPLOWO2_01_FULL_50_24]|nr:MAG: hypothetical protein A3A73_02600 [Omnitrophica bacterium RIFCSPLOWO2_01_FULL_50_24]
MTFELDPFQKNAIEWVKKNHSVLVSAPTGAGKTVIAEATIEQALSRGESVIYTAPIKALSNQKYRDFRARYGERVGILTGDVSINPDAAILIMTTEIYRNSLFESGGRIQNVGWVIFDEIHYLDDPERGTVWEEAILFTPLKTCILALSATVPNVNELADWIRSIHHRPIAVIEESHRPVPLEFWFQCQGEILRNTKDLRGRGYLGRPSWRTNWHDRGRSARPLRAKPNRLDPLLRHLIDGEKLPILYFAFGRRRTETLANESSGFDFLTASEREKISALYQDLLKRYDLVNESSAVELKPLVERGVAYHHAGMLPTLKEVVEQLFTSRLIKVIFTTETFALGINMPARSVIFDELEKFYGTGFRHLTTRDFYQMAGRAGRRGMDERGFVFVRINPHDIPLHDVEHIIYGKPEPIQSQFNTAYATLLQLHQQLGPKLSEIYPRTFHYYQSSEKRRRGGREHIERKLAMLEELGLLTKNALTEKGEFAARLFGYELLLTEMQGDGVLDGLNEAQLNVVLSSLVFEPRKGDRLPKLSYGHHELLKGVEHYIRLIHKKERKFHVFPYTKLPHFHLAATVEAWTQGESFDRLFRLTQVDEGELVRHFRMIIQILRDLAAAPHVSNRLRDSALRARRLINRDVVDAEKQLRVESI